MICVRFTTQDRLRTWTFRGTRMALKLHEMTDLSKEKGIPLGVFLDGKCIAIQNLWADAGTWIVDDKWICNRFSVQAEDGG